MNDSQAERWVVVSALTVAGIYAYRRLTETPAAPPVTVKELAGAGDLPPLGAWATAWGFTFLGVSVIATAAPELGAAFALLIAASDLLTNAKSIFGDIGKQEGAQGMTDPQTLKATQAANLFDTPTGVQPFHTGVPTFIVPPTLPAVPHGTHTRPGVATPGAS